MNFHPKTLLSCILRIYVHLYGADTQGDFVSAVVADGRSYQRATFAEAVRLASRVDLPDVSGNYLAKLQQLLEALQLAEASSTAAEEVPFPFRRRRSENVVLFTCPSCARVLPCLLVLRGPQCCLPDADCS